MPCTAPIQAWLSANPNHAGKRVVVFKGQSFDLGESVLIPCGRCDSCLLERSRQWAIRCSHEASLWSRNCFITLTYADQFLPPNGSVLVRHCQLFMKKLRKRFTGVDSYVDEEGVVKRPIRFFLCGEYGKDKSRPHYHACLFNFDFLDKIPYRVTKRGDQVWLSDSLSSLWGMGLSEVGSFSFRTAGYVSRYVCKKVYGPSSSEFYGESVDSDGVVSFLRHPEFLLMSRRPGLGRRWFDKFKDEVYPFDEIVVGGKRMRPPKYYDRLFEVFSPPAFSDLVAFRTLSFDKEAVRRGPSLDSQAKVVASRLSLLRRSYEG